MKFLMQFLCKLQQHSLRNGQISGAPTKLFGELKITNMESSSKNMNHKKVIKPFLNRGT